MGSDPASPPPHPPFPPAPIPSLLILLAFLRSPEGAAAWEADKAVAPSALFWTAITSRIDLAQQLTCYICVNVTDNDVCNRYAIDRPCPEDKLFCHSLHVLEGFGSSGDSLLVNKRCAGEDECHPKSVGCRRERGQTTCVSCCDHEYCNERAPVDAETAIFVRTRSCGVSLVTSHRLPVIFSALSWMLIWSRSNNIRDFIAET